MELTAMIFCPQSSSFPASLGAGPNGTVHQCHIDFSVPTVNSHVHIIQG